MTYCAVCGFRGSVAVHLNIHNQLVLHYYILIHIHISIVMLLVAVPVRSQVSIAEDAIVVGLQSIVVVAAVAEEVIDPIVSEVNRIFGIRHGEEAVLMKRIAGKSRSRREWEKYKVGREKPETSRSGARELLRCRSTRRDLKRHKAGRVVATESVVDFQINSRPSAAIELRKTMFVSAARNAL
jgi:hypothetical protein